MTMVHTSRSRPRRFVRLAGPILAMACGTALLGEARASGEEAAAARAYDDRLVRMASPRLILADYPDFVQPVREAMATSPASLTPACATNAAVSSAALDLLITQVSWIRPLN